MDMQRLLETFLLEADDEKKSNTAGNELHSSVLS